MLSGETSVGEFPIETVETMARIIASTEDHGLARMAAIDWQPRTRGGVIAKAAAEVAERVGAKYLVAFTQSGDSARRLSRYRGPIPMLAFTPVPVGALAARRCRGASRRSSTRAGRAHRRDGPPGRRAPARRSAGSRRATWWSSSRARPPGIPGSTNALRIHRMGDAINEVAPAYRRRS